LPKNIIGTGGNDMPAATPESMIEVERRSYVTAFCAASSVGDKLRIRF
jgi:hypothetical protein